MTVAYDDNDFPAWVVGSIIAAVVGSLLISALYMKTLFQNAQLELVKRKYREDISQPAKVRLRMYLQDDSTDESNNDDSAPPIGDLFPATTLLFADIVGFQSWSSEREPQAVFTLLQTIFHAFEQIGKSKGVFTLESTGDSYVALTGFPHPQADHAALMVKHAKSCLQVASQLLESLAITLGPGTAELKLRFGIHSGPITAGVFSGAKEGRLQLVGESMKTAVQVATSGVAGCIRVSNATAELLQQAGLMRRLLVHRAQELGGPKSYWVRDSALANSLMENADRKQEPSQSCISEFDSSAVDYDFLHAPTMEIEGIQLSAEASRLVAWHVDWMKTLLKQIVARRTKMLQGANMFTKKESFVPHHHVVQTSAEAMPLNEVAEIITLPEFDKRCAPSIKEVEAVVIKEEVVSQLRTFVAEISQMYRDNPFHNFEHASHVTMSVHKLLNRIANPDQVNYEESARMVAAGRHNQTFGITSDPLTHFAVVFSALIHDVDHIGVSNGQLAKENPALAAMYDNKSIAEQNSVDKAWEKLTQPRFKELHECLFGDECEFQRFRRLVVNLVLATDIFDKELKELRNMRWDKAFHPEKYNEEAAVEVQEHATSQPRFGGIGRSASSKQLKAQRDEKKRQGTNRKATIVLEHIIQASDVSHTMQHWNAYTKWNEKLFQEMYIAWKLGRTEKDPSLGWFKGEIWFFDNYVIPLSKKLADCGVFGVASDESYLNAVSNRKDWEAKGEAIVEQMLEKTKAKYEESVRHWNQNIEI